MFGPDKCGNDYKVVYLTLYVLGSNCSFFAFNLLFWPWIMWVSIWVKFLLLFGWLLFVMLNLFLD